MLCAHAKGSEGGMNAGTIVHLVHMVLQKVLLTTDYDGHGVPCSYTAPSLRAHT